MKKICILLSLVWVLTGCRKESEDFDGPSLQDIYGEFSLLEDFAVSQSTVDFENGETCYFTARFSKPVNWTISITGQTSGAVKHIQGQSDVLDKTNALWNGSTTEFPTFKAEKCEVMLTIKDETDTLKTTVKSLSPKLNEGFVIADFDTPGFDPKWETDIQSGADMDFQVKQNDTAAQGTGYLKMQGVVTWDWFIGLVRFPAEAYGTTGYIPLDPDPDQYFNCVIYGQPDKPNRTLLLFRFKEDENGDGVFDQNTEDMYEKQVWVEWEGWKKLSVKYSDLTALFENNPVDPKGNKLHEPNKLMQVSVLCLANPDYGLASSMLDYMIFTPEPLEP